MIPNLEKRNMILMLWIHRWPVRLIFRWAWTNCVKLRRMYCTLCECCFFFVDYIFFGYLMGKRNLHFIGKVNLESVHLSETFVFVMEIFWISEENQVTRNCYLWICETKVGHRLIYGIFGYCEHFLRTLVVTRKHKSKVKQTIIMTSLCTTGYWSN